MLHVMKKKVGKRQETMEMIHLREPAIKPKTLKKFDFKDHLLSKARLTLHNFAKTKSSFKKTR